MSWGAVRKLKVFTPDGSKASSPGVLMAPSGQILFHVRVDSSDPAEVGVEMITGPLQDWTPMFSRRVFPQEKAQFVMDPVPQWRVTLRGESSAKADVSYWVQDDIDEARLITETEQIAAEAGEEKPLPPWTLGSLEDLV